MIKLAVEVLEVVLVVLQIGERVCKTGCARHGQRVLYLVPPLRNFENNASHLRVKMIFNLVIAPVGTVR